MSKRITKAISKEIASRLCEKYDLKLNSIDDQIKEFVTKSLESNVPKDVKDFFKKNPGFTKSHTSLCLGKEFGWRYIYFTTPIPYDHLQDTGLNSDDELILKKFFKAQKTTESKKESIYNDIVKTMLSLRTYKKVEEVFPEAFALLPKESQSLLPMAKIDDLRNELKEELN